MVEPTLMDADAGARPAWWDGPMAVLDLETTSADPREARIVEIAIALVGGGRKPWARTALVNPGVEIPEEAAAIHGFSTEHVREHGGEWGLSVAWLAQQLVRVVEFGCPLVIYNAPYDLTVCDREFRRHGGEPGWLAEIPVVDPLMLDRHLQRYRSKREASRSLTDVCGLWGIRIGEAHSATHDLVATATLARQMLRHAAVVRRVRNAEERDELNRLQAGWLEARADVGRLQEYQRRLYREYADEFEAWVHAGDPSKDVPAQPDRWVPKDWPIIPWEGTEV